MADKNTTTVTTTTFEESEMPVWKKYILTINEAAEYFSISGKKLRQLANDHMDYGFALLNGNKILIKRNKFEEFLDATETI